MQKLDKCQNCDLPVEAVQYKFCYDCWWAQDPRNKAPKHNHVTRDIKSKGECPACDVYHKKLVKERMLQIEQELFQELKADGQKILAQLIPELNAISDVHIRKTKDLYRREEDFNEMCILLALLKMKVKNGLIELW